LTWKLPVDGIVCVEAVGEWAPPDGGTTIAEEDGGTKREPQRQWIEVDSQAIANQW